MNDSKPHNIDNLIDETEQIAVIGSPSSTSDLALDVLGSAVNRKLVGELALFRYLQDGLRNYALGQITEISLRNIWHEDPTMRSLIRQRGRVDAVSERQDTHLGNMTVSAVFADNSGAYSPSILGTVPATGTSINIVDDRILDELLRPYRDQLFYLGHVYGSQPRLPLWFKHFGSGPNGVGEAYHIGIFGKTGSGKSVLAKMILLAYSKHEDMGLLILDPQGEFSQAMRDEDFPTRMGRVLSPPVLRSIGRNFDLYDLGRIQLDRWEVLSRLLVEFRFFFDLGVKSTDYQNAVADSVEDFLRRDSRHRLSSLDDQAYEDVLDHIDGNIQRVYGTAAGIDRVRDFVDEARGDLRAGNTNPTKEKWDRTIALFRARADSQTPSHIVQRAISPEARGNRPMVIVDLSQRPEDVSQSVWDDQIKPLLIDRFISGLVFEAERAHREEVSLNTLVVLDEAHRLAPQGRTRNERFDRIKVRLVDAVRTTRKYGLGWMFLSQTLSSLDSEIVGQLRISFFGFGLSMGAEFQKLRQLAGEQQQSIRLYQRFRDPQSTFDPGSKEYSFMTVGPVSPLSFAGTPLFLNAYTAVTSFLTANGISQSVAST